MKQSRQLILWLLGILLLLAGCSEKESTPGIETTIDIPAGGLILLADGSGKTLKITADPVTKWAFSGMDNAISVIPSNGQGSAEVLISAVPHNNPEDNHMTLTFKAGIDMKEISVTLKKKDAIILSKDNYSLDKDGGDIRIEFTSNMNCDYRITSGGDAWIHLLTNRAMESKSYTFHIDRNETQGSRSAEIIITDNNKTLSDTIHLSQSSVSTKEILTAFYHSTHGDQWANKTNWLSDEPYEKWYGLRVENDMIVGLDLRNNNLSGSLPNELCDLASLSRIMLSSNRLSGNIPNNIGNLKNLKALELMFNSLSGELPASLYGLTELDWLELSGNQLSGNISGQLGKLSKLTRLGLQNNLFSGPIPKELGNLTELETLTIGGYPMLSALLLTGNIPAELGRLRKLTYLAISCTRLAGSIPVELCNLPELITLHIQASDITGVIPAQIGNLSTLKQLDLANNKLSGPIPSEIGNLHLLELLWLEGNNLEGSVPATLGQLVNIKIPFNSEGGITLARNRLTGVFPPEIRALPVWNKLYPEDIFLQQPGYGFTDIAQGIRDLGDQVYLHPDDRVISMLVTPQRFQEWNQGDQNFKDITQKIYTKFNDDFDFVFIILNQGAMLSGAAGLHQTVQNHVKNIGIPEGSDASWGSPAKLQGVMTLYSLNYLKQGPSLHEFAHQWAAHIVPTFSVDGNGQQIDYGGHWGVSDAGGQLGGFKAEFLEKNIDGVPNQYRARFSADRQGFGDNANGGNGLPYSPIELYLMGFAPKEEVPVLNVYSGLSVKSMQEFQKGYFYANAVTPYTIDEMIRLQGGERIPSYSDSPKEFKVLTVVLSPRDLQQFEWDMADTSVAWFSTPGDDGDNNIYNFWEATKGRGKIKMDGLSGSLTAR